MNLKRAADCLQQAANFALVAMAHKWCGVSYMQFVASSRAWMDEASLAFSEPPPVTIKFSASPTKEEE